MGETIFSKILRKEIPADIVYEDEHCLAFRDINPVAPTHVLVIPRTPIVNIAEMDDGQVETIGRLFLGARNAARALGVDQDGYRLVVNNGAEVGQTVFHLHVHILAGRALSWPPG
jgi:histidine triad (HIT) family protein